MNKTFNFPLKLVNVMKHYYATINNVVITYGDIRQGEFVQEIPVYFERDDGNGDFDFAEGSLPSCYFNKSRGFSELELQKLSRFLRNNMKIIFDEARGLE